MLGEISNQECVEERLHPQLEKKLGVVVVECVEEWDGELPRYCWWGNDLSHTSHGYECLYDMP